MSVRQWVCDPFKPYIYLINLIIFVKLLSYLFYLDSRYGCVPFETGESCSICFVYQSCNQQQTLPCTNNLHNYSERMVKQCLAHTSHNDTVLLNRLCSTAELTVHASHQHNTLEREVDRPGGGGDWGKALELGLVINGPGLVWPHALAPFSGVSSTGVQNNLEILRRSVRLRYPVLAVHLNVFTNCWRVTQMRCFS